MLEKRESMRHAPLFIVGIVALTAMIILANTNQRMDSEGDTPFEDVTGNYYETIDNANYYWNVENSFQIHASSQLAGAGLFRLPVGTGSRGDYREINYQRDLNANHVLALPNERDLASKYDELLGDVGKACSSIYGLSRADSSFCKWSPARGERDQRQKTVGRYALLQILAAPNEYFPPSVDFLHPRYAEVEMKSFSGPRDKEVKFHIFTAGTDVRANSGAGRWKWKKECTLRADTTSVKCRVALDRDTRYLVVARSSSINERTPYVRDVTLYYPNR